MKKLLSLDDLYNFYLLQDKNCTFSSNNCDTSICVQVPEVMTFSKDYDPDEFKLKTHLKSCHILENRNHSSISEESMKQAIPSFYNAPILGYIHQLSDGSYDFAGHEMYMDENDEVVYKEIPVGVIPESCNAQLVYDEENDKTYLEVDGIIFKEYTKAAEILENKQTCKVSVELSVDELSYSADTKLLNIEKFHFMGVTILGTTDDEYEDEIQEGMKGSNITISDFSLNNNSICTRFKQSDEITKLLKELNDKVDALSCYTQEKSKEGGNEKEMNKLEELLNKYNKTVEELTFEYEGLSDEDLELAFVEAFEKPKKKIEDDDAPVVTETPDEDKNGDDKEDETPEPQPEPEVEPTPDVDAQDLDAESEDDTAETFDSDNEPEEEKPLDEPETSEEFEDDNETIEKTVEESEKKYSLTVNGVVKEFSVSMNAKLEAITTLVNDTYADDLTWYCCEVFDDDKNVVMIDCWTGKAYRQGYKCKDDVFSLKGDRVEVFSTWMTSDEQKAFESMKGKFEEVSDKLAKYEAEPEKLQILESEEYSSIADKTEFTELKKQENHFNLSVDELKTKADEIILAYAKKGALNFASNETTPSIGAKQLIPTNPPKKRSRYGGLGKKEN